MTYDELDILRTMCRMMSENLGNYLDDLEMKVSPEELAEAQEDLQRDAGLLSVELRRLSLPE